MRARIQLVMIKPGIVILLAICVRFLFCFFFCTGDHIRDVGKVYHHHMLVVEVIDSSRLIVIHYTGELFKSSRATVVEEGIKINLTEKNIHKLQYKKGVARYTGMKAVDRARTKLKEEKYNIFWNNCESFVNWAITGENQTNQGRAALVGGTLLGVAAVGAAVFGILTVFKGPKNSKNSDS